MTVLRDIWLIVGALILAPMPLILTAAPVAAQSPSQAVDQAYEELYEVIQAGIDKEKILDSAMDAMRADFAANPSFMMVEAQRPGFMDEVISGARPVIRDFHARIRAQYRPQIIAVYANNMTPQEARSLAALYGSDGGRRLAAGVVGNLSGKEGSTDRTLQSDEEIRSEIQSDITTSASATLSDLSEAEYEEIRRMVEQTPAVQRMAVVNPQVHAVQAQMAREKLTRQETERIDNVIRAAVARRMQ